MNNNLVAVDVEQFIPKDGKELLLSELLVTFTKQLNNSGYKIECNKRNDRVVVKK